MAKSSPFTGRWTGVYLALSLCPLLFFFIQPNGFSLDSHPMVNQFFVYAPDLILILVAILGWQISQTRIFWASLSDLLIYHYLLHPDFLVPLPADRLKTFDILVVGLPLFWTILFSLKECRLLSEQSLSRMALAGSPLLLLLALSGWAPEIHHKLLHWKFLWGPAAVWPECALLTLMALTAAVYLIHEPKIKPFLAAFFISRVPFYLSLYVGLALTLPDSQGYNRFLVILSFLFLSAISLHVILHMYWNRVYQDPLTGIPNRQALDDRLHTLRGQYALAMVDIDHFKKFNDTYGHAEGDNVLRMVAQHLLGHLGKDTYRYGGEEFCAVFEGELKDEAESRMEVARKTLEKRKFNLRTHRRREGEESNSEGKKGSRGGKVQITFSAGIADHKKTSVDYHDVIKRADKALYEAKEAGRNRVVKAK